MPLVEWRARQVCRRLYFSECFRRLVTRRSVEKDALDRMGLFTKGNRRHQSANGCENAPMLSSRHYLIPILGSEEGNAGLLMVFLSLTR